MESPRTYTYKYVRTYIATLREEESEWSFVGAQRRLEIHAKEKEREEEKKIVNRERWPSIIICREIERRV